jgi:hypothetical protein
MFKKLAKSGLMDFSVGGFRKPWRVATHRAGLFNQAPANDNFPGRCRPTGRRRIAPPMLACHWLIRNGRLECRWQADDAPIADVDEPARRATPRVFT